MKRAGGNGGNQVAARDRPSYTMAEAARYLFYNMGVGAFIYLMGQFNLFAPDKDFPVGLGTLDKSVVKLGGTRTVTAGGVSLLSAPSISPASRGVADAIASTAAKVGPGATTIPAPPP